jgi:hypothetical protein
MFLLLIAVNYIVETLELRGKLNKRSSDSVISSDRKE